MTYGNYQASCLSSFEVGLLLQVFAPRAMNRWIEGQPSNDNYERQSSFGIFEIGRVTSTYASLSAPLGKEIAIYNRGGGRF